MSIFIFGILFNAITYSLLIGISRNIVITCERNQCSGALYVPYDSFDGSLNSNIHILRLFCNNCVYDYIYNCVNNSCMYKCISMPNLTRLIAEL